MPDLYLRQRPDGSVYFGPMDAPVVVPPVVVPPAPIGKAYGIAWSGLEYAPDVAGRPDLDITPTAAQFFSARGVKLFRVAFNWFRLQPTLNAPLHPVYLARLKNAAQIALDAGCKIVLDAHNFGRYSGIIVGTAAVPNSAFYDFWRRLATEFKGHPGVWAYGLMNEPHDTNGLWIAGGAYQAGIDGVRSVDQQTMLLVSGDNWDGADQFKVDNINDALRPRDPANRFAIEAHIYFDGGSGTYKPTDLSAWTGLRGSIPDATRRIKVFTDWLDKTGYQGWIGEWGVPCVGGTNEEWLPILDAVYAQINAHPKMIGASLWVAGGPGVGDASSWQYNGSQAVPVGAADNAHWKVLSKYPTGVL